MTNEPDKPLRCSECGREPREDENPDDEWRVYSDGTGAFVELAEQAGERTSCAAVAMWRNDDTLDGHWERAERMLQAAATRQRPGSARPRGAGLAAC